MENDGSLFEDIAPAPVAPKPDAVDISSCDEEDDLSLRAQRQQKKRLEKRALEKEERNNSDASSSEEDDDEEGGTGAGGRRRPVALGVQFVEYFHTKNPDEKPSDDAAATEQEQLAQLDVASLHNKVPSIPCRIPMGRVSRAPCAQFQHVVSGVAVFERTSSAFSVVDVGTVLVLPNGRTVGHVSSMLGNINRCSYAVVLPREDLPCDADSVKRATGEGSDDDSDDDENRNVTIADLRAVMQTLSSDVCRGMPVHYDTKNCTIIEHGDVEKLCDEAKHDATDASFVEDRELPLGVKPDFSDDDKEIEWKRNRKAQRRTIGDQSVEAGEAGTSSSESEKEFDHEGNLLRVVKEHVSKIAKMRKRQSTSATAPHLPRPQSPLDTAASSALQTKPPSAQDPPNVLTEEDERAVAMRLQQQYMMDRMMGGGGSNRGGAGRGSGRMPQRGGYEAARGNGAGRGGWMPVEVYDSRSQPHRGGGPPPPHHGSSRGDPFQNPRTEEQRNRPPVRERYESAPVERKRSTPRQSPKASPQADVGMLPMPDSSFALNNRSARPPPTGGLPLKASRLEGPNPAASQQQHYPPPPPQANSSSSVMGSAPPDLVQQITQAVLAQVMQQQQPSTVHHHHHQHHHQQPQQPAAGQHQEHRHFSSHHTQPPVHHHHRHHHHHQQQQQQQHHHTPHSDYDGHRRAAMDERHQHHHHHSQPSAEPRDGQFHHSQVRVQVRPDNSTRGPPPPPHMGRGAQPPTHNGNVDRQQRAPPPATVPSFPGLGGRPSSTGGQRDSAPPPPPPHDRDDAAVAQQASSRDPKDRLEQLRRLKEQKDELERQKQGTGPQVPTFPGLAAQKH